MALREWLKRHVAVHDLSPAPETTRPSPPKRRKRRLRIESDDEDEDDRRDYGRDAERLGIDRAWLEFLAMTPEQISELARIAARAEAERERGVRVYPERDDVHRWSRLCPPKRVRVVIVGQDPYHDGSACGVAFGTTADRPPPPSLVTVFRELERSVPGFEAPRSGCLDAWCRQGVLLLNSVFTVAAGRPGSHEAFGWQMLSQRVVRALSERRRGLVFMLWGLRAQKKEPLIDASRHLILKSCHPSPRAQNPARREPFVGNDHFVLANEYLARQEGGRPVDWTALTADPKTPREEESDEEEEG